MSFRHQVNVNNRTSAQHNVAVSVRRSRYGAWQIKRARRENNSRRPFVPPEDWYEPSNSFTAPYRIEIQEPGEGYRHILTAAEIRARLDELPRYMIEPLQVIQLSRMTRKKQSFPCYGMQWGSALYLYPMEAGLVEHFVRPPRPSLRNETQMYGGRWIHEAPQCWKLIWTEGAIKDFYLNNILIHELGHLLDSRNSSYLDRERFAEWFAIEHGYKPSRRAELAKRGAAKMVRRRHHSAH